MMSYDPDTRQLVVGSGSFGPVDARVWHYEVGGANVLSRWFSSRKAVPGGKRSSALDAIVSTSWEPEWTSELIEILSVLTRLVEKEDEQAEILAGVDLRAGLYDASTLSGRSRLADHEEGPVTAAPAVAAAGGP